MKANAVSACASVNALQGMYPGPWPRRLRNASSNSVGGLESVAFGGVVPLLIHLALLKATS